MFIKISKFLKGNLIVTLKRIFSFLQVFFLLLFFCIIFKEIQKKHLKKTDIKLCEFPIHSLWPSGLEVFNFKPDPIVCDPIEKDFVFVKQGIVFYRNEYFNKITCNATIKFTKDGEEISELKYAKVYDGETIVVKNGSEIPSDVFQINCFVELKNGTLIKYSKLILSIKKQLDFINKLNVNNDKFKEKNSINFKYNILIFQFDSVSRMNWLRRLKKTVNKFKNLGGIWFEKVNNLGKGTIKALLPMLTGRREFELYEAQRGFENAKHLDDFPWIWNDFKKMGYAFLWGDKSTFHYRFLGFKQLPSLHYARPWFLSVDKERKNHKKYCIGNETRHEILLNYLAEFWQAYNSIPKLSFINYEEMSHDNFVDIELIDDAHSKWLDKLNDSKVLENTIVILMSDHGLLYTKAATGPQMEFEALNPYIGILFPESFRTNHKHLFKNFKLNFDKLITPLDIHATISELVNIISNYTIYPKIHKNSISLFKKIPSKRNCFESNIPIEYCLCFHYEKVIHKSTIILRMINFIERKINENLINFNKICHKLTIKKIISIEKSISRLPFYKLNFLQSFTIFKFIIQMKEKNITFKVIVVFKMSIYNFEPLLNIREISRLDKYAEMSKCISNKYPKLAPFCYCY